MLFRSILVPAGVGQDSIGLHALVEAAERGLKGLGIADVDFRHSYHPRGPRAPRRRTSGLPSPRSTSAHQESYAARAAAVNVADRSPEMEAALTEGLMAAGIAVTRVGRGPTPMLYFAGTTMPADGAIMVTGSHNPPDYNGFKMMRAGKPFYGADIQKLKQAGAAR